MLRFGGTLRRRLALALVVLVVLVLGTAAAANVWAQARYDAAARALREYRLDDARHEIRQCLRVWRRSPSAHFLAARIERHRGDYQQAEHYLEACRRLKEPDADWQLEWLLLRAQRGGELDKVERGLWNCVRQNTPDTLPILEALARAYMRHMRFLMALRALDEWLQREPDTVRALEWRGWVKERVMNPRGAADDYRRALELNPEQAGTRIRLADILLDFGDPVNAGPHVGRLMQNHADLPEAQLVVARYRLVKGDLDEARSLLDRVLAVQPGNASALGMRGQVELDANQPAGAEPWLRQALKREPFLVTAHHALHTCLRQQGNREPEADAAFRRYEELRKDADRLTKLLSGGKVEIAPHDASVPSEIGAIFLRTGQEPSGLYWLEHVALQRDPVHLPTHEILARYYEKKKQPADAARHREAIRKARHRASAASPST